MIMSVSSKGRFRRLKLCARRSPGASIMIGHVLPPAAAARHDGGGIVRFCDELSVC
jgi:hypothetical protein